MGNNCKDSCIFLIVLAIGIACIVFGNGFLLPIKREKCRTTSVTADLVGCPYCERDEHGACHEESVPWVCYKISLSLQSIDSPSCVGEFNATITKRPPKSISRLLNETTTCFRIGEENAEDCKVVSEEDDASRLPELFAAYGIILLLVGVCILIGLVGFAFFAVSTSYRRRGFKEMNEVEMS